MVYDAAAVSNQRLLMYGAPRQAVMPLLLRGLLLTPDYIGGGGMMVSHMELYAFASMLIAFATLIYSIAKKK